MKYLDGLCKLRKLLCTLKWFEKILHQFASQPFTVHDKHPVKISVKICYWELVLHWKWQKKITFYNTNRNYTQLVFNLSVWVPELNKLAVSYTVCTQSKLLLMQEKGDLPIVCLKNREIAVFPASANPILVREQL